MASPEQTHTQEFPETPETRRDAEGVDMHETQEHLSLPHNNDNHTSHIEPSGQSVKSTGEVTSEPGIEGEFNADAAQEGPPRVEIENVVAEKGEHGWAYFYVVPAEARELPEFKDGKIHLGDYSGGGQEALGSIAEQARGLHERVGHALAEHQAEMRAGAVNHRIDSTGREVREDDDMTTAVIAEGYNPSPNPEDHPEAFHRQQEGYQRLDHEQTVEQTRFESNNEEDEYREARDRGLENAAEYSEGQPSPENIALEDAGRPEFTPREITEAEMERRERENPSIPQEARDTPHDPLDPKKPPSHLLGTNNVPPGDFVPELQSIPGQPDGPHLSGPELDL